MGLVLASVVTLLLLFTFLAIVALPIVLAFGYLLGLPGILIVGLVMGITVVINFLAWLFSPWIADFIYRYLYKLEWISIEELRERHPETTRFVEDICEEYGFRIPKLGLIPDRNPNAFTYGSGRWNSRLVVTEGMFEYLDQDELTAVYAHELGHIQHRDFIIMTIASTLLQLIYEFYASIQENATDERGSAFRFQLRRNHSNRGGKLTDETEKARTREQGINLLQVAALVAYVLYWLGTYTILYLSRVREYYADEFATKEADPDHLCASENGVWHSCKSR